MTHYKSILKFGGTSVGSSSALLAVKQIVAERYQEESLRPVAVVVSAFHGITDLLIKLAKIAASGSTDWQPLLAKMLERHLTTCKELKLQDESLEAKLSQLGEDLHAILLGIGAVKELSPKTNDAVMSFGERLSIEIVACLLRTVNPEARAVDSREYIKTTATFGNAQVFLTETHALLRATEFGTLPVFAGFIASTLSNVTTTLGRGGSDYTAALLGRAFQVAEIEIWTDVDGVLTADPRKVKSAFPLPTLSYQEAMELSHFGAKVIYPPTMQPALSAGIPVLIKNTFNPKAPGTKVGNFKLATSRTMSGIASLSSVALFNVEGSGMQGVSGVAARIFGCLAREKISIILITQASSEHTICFAVSPLEADQAKEALESELALEIKNEQIQPLAIEKDLAIIAAVGDGMRQTPGVAGTMFSALGRNGINIRAIAQGSSERNISAVISARDEGKALQALHDSLFLSGSKKVHLYVAGMGLIGKELVAIVESQREKMFQEKGISIVIAGLANSQKFIVTPEGASLKHLSTVDNESESASAFIDAMLAAKTANSIFVDCSASDTLPRLYKNILSSSISIVTPNKRGNADTLEQYLDLKKTAKRSRAKYLYETTVGAGLPVLSTLQDLMASGDTVIQIDAVLSGTLSFLWNQMQPGVLFSSLVGLAKSKGLTEPDPRDDLSGKDVARKVLILAREAGFNFESHQVSVEPLVNNRVMEAKDIPLAMEALKTMDEIYSLQVAEAAAAGQKLCFLASITKDGAKVALKAIGPESPFYSLSGTDNMISFTTERYKVTPLVVRGPGAGKEVTAAGVFADIIRAASYAE